MLELILPSNPRKATYKKISNPFRKILYLFALHSDHPLYLKHKDNLIGVLDIIDGLEYHIKNLRHYEKAACNRSVELRSIFNQWHRAFRAEQQPNNIYSDQESSNDHK